MELRLENQALTINLNLHFKTTSKNKRNKGVKIV